MLPKPLAVVASIFRALGAASAQPLFYQDKTITLVVGTIPGSQCAVLARIIARHPLCCDQSRQLDGYLHRAGHLLQATRRSSRGALDFARFNWIGSVLLICCRPALRPSGSSCCANL